MIAMIALLLAVAPVQEELENFDNQEVEVVLTEDAESEELVLNEESEYSDQVIFEDESKMSDLVPYEFEVDCEGEE